MDHAEVVETEGHAPQNEIVDDHSLRGSSTGPTAESMDDGGDAMEIEVNDPPTAHDEAYGSMDADSADVDDNSLDLWDDSGLASAAAAEPSDTTASLMSTLAAATTGHHPVVVTGASERMEQPAFGASLAKRRDLIPGKPLDGGPAGPGAGGESAAGNKATRSTGVSEPFNSYTPPPSSDHLGTLSEQSSFDHGHDIMSADEEDIHSDKASSLDAQQSEPDVPPPQDQHQAGQVNERTPLESAYGPFIHPTDTCLSDARERLHVALEQTRLLRASFTEQAYERYRCVMKPVPESLNEIVGPIHSDPKQAGAVLREQDKAIKVEKDTEKKHSQEAGVGLEELAYFGEGLHLVILPEDDVDETEIDHAQFPHRGPIDSKSGERREEISAAAAATTEQVFDRIRRIRAIRMGADIVPGTGIPDSAAQMTRNPGQDQEAPNELLPPGCVSAPLASSPAPSVDSNAAERSSKGSLQHLLTLHPDVEGVRPDGSFMAVQSALIARGVGMNEINRDFRINPLRQRIFQPNYFSPSASPKFLPPLLGPHQLYRLEAVDTRKEGLEIRTNAKESIKFVIDEICSSESKGKSLLEDNRPKNNGIGSGDSRNGGIGRAPGEGHIALELGLLRRMHSTMLENRKEKNIPLATSDGISGLVVETMCPSIGSSRPDSDTDELDPLLAFSVMSAVGLVRREEGDCKNLVHQSHHDRNSENAYAHRLGLESLTDLDSVSNFFHTNSATGNGRKRSLSNKDGELNDAKKPKADISNTVNIDVEDDVVCQIRGGGRQDEVNAIESKAMSKESGETKRQKKNGVSQTKNKTDAPIPDTSLAGYAGFDPLYNAMSQVPLGDKQSQSVIAAAASRQLLQHQLGIHPDPYRTAALAHQLAVPPIGSHLTSLPASDLSDFYLRNGLGGNPDWSALRTTTPTVGADSLTQHPHLRTSLGLVPGQMNLTLPEQEAARTMLLRDHHNTAAARAHEAVTAAAAARYQAALSSINPQNPFGFVTSSLSQLRSNETPSISSLPAFRANQRKEASSIKVQRQRSSSLSGKPSRNKINKESNGIDIGKPDQDSDMKRPASAPPSPPSFETKSTTPNGGSSANVSSKRIVSRDEASISERGFAVPTPPKGLRPEIADLIARAEFHEAHSLSQQKSDDSETLLIKFLLSLGEAVPIPKEFITDSLVRKLSSSNYHLRLHEFVGNSSSASASRDVIVAIISIWLWAEHQDYLKQSPGEEKDEADPSYNWLISLAVEKSLSALATFFDSHPSGKSDGATSETRHAQVAAIASQSLAKNVFVDYRADATFPIVEDLLKLLDSLRTDALRVKTQERVLLAALTSRCGNMSEAFSNAYVSSIVRAGVALGHENVCEIGQNEECRASTMLPYDFFHDNVGVWEEPCRPTTGYHVAVNADQLKKQAHARSVIQKSMKRLQNRFNLKGGISDGGPYFPMAAVNDSTPSTTATVLPLVRTSSGLLKRRSSHEIAGVAGTGPADTVFNPDHTVVPMHWKPNDVANFPYGQHELGVPTGMSENKKRKLSQYKGGKPEDQAAPLDLQYRSTEELEWEDVANMFFHGGSTRSIDINYDFGSNDHLGKKKIFAPYVRAFDRSVLQAEREAENSPYSDEDISDETVFQRHQDVLDEMKLKLDSALESRKQHVQPRGRKR